MPKFDAHAHFFRPGFAEIYPEQTRRQVPDEVTLYHALAQQHDIAAVLAVGYEGEPWAEGNNDYLARIVQHHPWLYPLAYCHQPAKLTITALEAWQAQGFVGITFYLLDDDTIAQLEGISAEVWQWLTARHWLISVNGKAACWQAWLPIVAQWPELTLLISHLGLPPVAPPGMDVSRAQQRLTQVLALHTAPHVYVKLSGFYALASPSHAYPHHAAWIYVEQVAQTFGTHRLLWGSDFSPALEHVSFAQTVDVLDHMPYFTPDERNAIYGDNLAALLRMGAQRSV